MRIRQRIGAVVGLAIVCACAAPAEAQQPAESADAARVDEIVITATGFPTRLFEAPYTAQSVTRDDMDRRLYRTTPQALRDIPGVMVQETSPGHGSPYIRGFTGFRNVLLVDGVRVNNSVFRDGPNEYWNLVDPLSIQRLEVVKGPGSVLYGSDAIGGTVNAITKSPYSYGEGLRFGGEGYYRVSSAENSHQGRGELSVSVNDTFGTLVGGGYGQFGDLIGGGDVGRQPNTGYDRYNGDVKAEYFFNEQTRLVFAHQRVRLNNVPRTHSTIHGVMFHGSSVGSDLRRDKDLERTLTYLQLHADEIGSAIDSMSLSASWQTIQDVRDRIRSNGARELEGFEAGTLGLWARLTSLTAIGKLTYGFEYYRDHVDSFSSRNPIQGPVGDDATYDLLGFYLQDTIELHEQWVLTLGGRVTYARADADSVQDPRTGERIGIRDDWTSVVGSARLAHYIVPDRVNLFAGVSQGFRAPNLSDLTRLDVARSNEIETPAPGLDPEKYVAFEVGAKGNFDDLTVQASYFYTLIDDMIVRAPTGEMIDGAFEVTKLNGGDGFVQGVELGAAWRFHEQWTLFGNLTWMDGRIETFPGSDPVARDEPIDRLLPLSGQVGLRWDPSPRKDIWVELQVVMADEADRLSTRDKSDTQRIPPGGTPGYGIVNLRGGWSPTERIDLTLSLENLLDHDYRVHGSGSNMPGFNAIFAASVRF